MGAWGVGIFQNDVGVDVKNLYIEKLKLGKTDEEALNETIGALAKYVSDEEDSIDFWLALSSVMYDYGRLNCEIKDKAISIIRNSVDVERWETSSREKRKTVLNELEGKLCSGQPPRKRVTIFKKWVPEINRNDVYYFELNGDTKLYVWILVDSWINCDFRAEGLGDQLPIVYFKVSRNMPMSTTEVNEMKFFCVDGYKWIYEDISKCEKRIVMNNKGFSKFKSRLNFFGTFEFSRPKESELHTITAESIRYNETPMRTWLDLDERINYIVKNSPGSGEWIC